MTRRERVYEKLSVFGNNAIDVRAESMMVVEDTTPWGILNERVTVVLVYDKTDGCVSYNENSIVSNDMDEEFILQIVQALFAFDTYRSDGSNDIFDYPLSPIDIIDGYVPMVYDEYVYQDEIRYYHIPLFNANVAMGIVEGEDSDEAINKIISIVGEQYVEEDFN